MSEEDELLNRTLQRCLREVRKALDADSDVKALATCKAGKGSKVIIVHTVHHSLCVFGSFVYKESAATGKRESQERLQRGEEAAETERCISRRPQSSSA